MWLPPIKFLMINLRIVPSATQSKILFQAFSSCFVQSYVSNKWFMKSYKFYLLWISLASPIIPVSLSVLSYFKSPSMFPTFSRITKPSLSSPLFSGKSICSFLKNKLHYHILNINLNLKYVPELLWTEFEDVGNWELCCFTVLLKERHLQILFLESCCVNSELILLLRWGCIRFFFVLFLNWLFECLFLARRGCSVLLIKNLVILWNVLITVIVSYFLI